MATDSLTVNLVWLPPVERSFGVDGLRSLITVRTMGV